MILLDTNVLTRMTSTVHPHVRRRFTLLSDRPELLAQWQALVTSLGVTGFRSHDARLVAAMQCYGVPRLLTFNIAHFCKLGATVVDPSTV